MSIEPIAISITGALNTLLLLIGIPVLVWLAKAVIGLIEAVKEVTGTIKEVKMVVLGTEDQGGLLRRVEGIAANVHSLNNQVTPLILEIDNLKIKLAEMTKERRATPRQ